MEMNFREKEKEIIAELEEMLCNQIDDMVDDNSDYYREVSIYEYNDMCKKDKGEEI